jgi:hypothetical protein
LSAFNVLLLIDWRDTKEGLAPPPLTFFNQTRRTASKIEGIKTPRFVIFWYGP